MENNDGRVGMHRVVQQNVLRVGLMVGIELQYV